MPTTRSSAAISLTYFEAEAIKLPIYELDYKGDKIALAVAYVGAPGAAVQIEVLTALGCRKYIACGGCGVLQKNIGVGHLIIPTAAVRDEETSYHYVKPARESGDKFISIWYSEVRT